MLCFLGMRAIAGCPKDVSLLQRLFIRMNRAEEKSRWPRIPTCEPDAMPIWDRMLTKGIGVPPCSATVCMTMIRWHFRSRRVDRPGPIALCRRHQSGVLGRFYRCTGVDVRSLSRRSESTTDHSRGGLTVDFVNPYGRYNNNLRDSQAVSLHWGMVG